MSHVGKRPRENRERRAEGVEEEEGLSASLAAVDSLNLPGLGKRSVCVCVCVCVCVLCVCDECGVVCVLVQPLASGNSQAL